MNARLEIAVAGQYRRSDDIVLHDRLVQLRREITRVADAGGAAVRGHAEAELLQVGQQAGRFQILGHHARSRRERGLDVRGHRQAGFHRLLREQAGAEQHARVGGVGAGSDRGNQHIAVADADAVGGFITCAEIFRFLVEAVFGNRLGEQLGEGRFDIADLDAVLRSLRACERRRDGTEIEHDDVGVIDLAHPRNAEHVLRLEIGLECVDLFLAAAGAPEIVDRRFIDREKAHGRAVFRRHVADGRAVGGGE